ncbi:helix-turn-helix transcriptional regulator [Xanthobacter agilis]|uniref:DNA-binding CsgD family transcriptional regulator n=1 Tax=Xanthobacter agilis TaxID=47492 RepID=A0ABU0LFS2_XANAG|nr:PAS domain-containing protein [Xanthobacter agilis]MDQ0505922.1 DNA-binding CsgD family transcriptional regulator [Xanthobacter agilis]
MDDLERYSRLIQNVYELSGDPDQWALLLADITDFLDGRVTQLAVYSLKPDRRPTWRVFGHDHQDYRTFIARHATEDPRLSYILSNPGRVICAEDGVDTEQFRATPWFREVVEPMDLEHSLVSYFAQEADVMATIASMRGREIGPFGAREKQRLGLVVPHLRRAFEYYALLDEAKAKVADIGAALDIVDAGIFLTDGDLNVAHVNRAGETLLKGGDIAVRGGRLAFKDARAGRQMTSAVTQALSAARGETPLPHADHIELPRHDGDATPYRVSLHPLPAGEGAARLTQRSQIAVVVRAPRRSGADVARRLQTSFHLTPAESALAAALAAGASLADYAQQRNVALSTVRSQLKALYEKTDTRRQGELVAHLRGSLDLTLA